MSIFCDTGFYFALLFKNDRHHSRSKDIIFDLADGKYGKIYTSDYVLNESFTLINVRTNGRRVDLLQTMTSFFISERPIAQLLSINLDMIIEIVELQKKFTSPNRILSFTDASNIFFCNKFKIENIISFDSNFEGILSIVR